ncbi:MAG: SRPBCC domain-containing protein [Terracidiphilus sp.]
MTTAISEIEDLKLNVAQEIRVDAPIDVTFDALLEQLGSGNERPNGEPMPMKLEAWPGGRWYRDLGDRNGHFWAVVQAIKRPALLELSGPLFMSYPVANNVQYRLRADGSGTVIEFHHLGLGLIEEAHRKGVATGWKYILEQAKKRAEQTR